MTKEHFTCVAKRGQSRKNLITVAALAWRAGATGEGKMMAY
jgi:hypothetical protein